MTKIVFALKQKKRKREHKRKRKRRLEAQAGGQAGAEAGAQAGAQALRCRFPVGFSFSLPPALPVGHRRRVAAAAVVAAAPLPAKADLLIWCPAESATFSRQIGQPVSRSVSQLVSQSVSK